MVNGQWSMDLSGQGWNELSQNLSEEPKNLDDLIERSTEFWNLWLSFNSHKDSGEKSEQKIAKELIHILKKFRFLIYQVRKNVPCY